MSAVHEVSIVCDECGRALTTGMPISMEARVVAIEAGWTHPSFGQDRCPEHPKGPSRRPIAEPALFSDVGEVPS